MLCCRSIFDVCYCNLFFNCEWINALAQDALLQDKDAMHPMICSSREHESCPLSRDPQTRAAKWARGSRSQTHRRAAKGGFTQDNGKVERRLASPIADRLVCSFAVLKAVTVRGS